MTIFVCTACQPAGANGGASLFARLLERSSCEASIRIEPVDCLAACDRSCTIAFSARDKWTYLIGDIDPNADAEDVLLAARRLAASDQPVLPLADRPPFFRKGIIGRVPFVA